MASPAAFEKRAQLMRSTFWSASIWKKGNMTNTATKLCSPRLWAKESRGTRKKVFSCD